MGGSIAIVAMFASLGLPALSGFWGEMMTFLGSYKSTYYEDLLLTHVENALDVVSDPDSGEPVCRSALNGNDTTCVPWNIFESGAVTPEQTGYLALPLFARGTTDQEVWNGYVQGSLGDYGVKMPWAETGNEPRPLSTL